jgi:uncharacterized protein (DUF1778 family)
MGSRDNQLQIRVSAAQKEAIRAAAARAGVGMSEWVLSRALPAPAAQLMSLARRADDGDSHAPWAEIIEVLQRLTGVDFQTTVSGLGTAGLSPFTANYLAALVEMTAAQVGRPAPAWTRSVAPLPTPWFGTRLRGLREHLLVHAPIPFRRRNIFVDAGVGDRV